MGATLLVVGSAVVGADSAVLGGVFVDSSEPGAGLRSSMGTTDNTTATAMTAIRTTKPRLVRYQGAGAGLNVSETFPSSRSADASSISLPHRETRSAMLRFYLLSAAQTEAPVAYRKLAGTKDIQRATPPIRYVECCTTYDRVMTSAPGEEQRLRDLKLLRKVRDRMDREYAQPLNVEALARGVNMSAGHLSRQFKSAYGESPYSYLMTVTYEVGHCWPVPG